MAGDPWVVRIKFPILQRAKGGQPLFESSLFEQDGEEEEEDGKGRGKQRRAGKAARKEGAARGLRTQRFRAGLTSFAPTALGTMRGRNQKRRALQRAKDGQPKVQRTET